MSATYNKVIVIEKAGEKVAVAIFDEKTHQPVIFGLNKLGMDELLELFEDKK